MGLSRRDLLCEVRQFRGRKSGDQLERYRRGRSMVAK